MLSYLEKLRHAPLPERRRAALWLTALVVGVVILIWLTMLGVRYWIFSPSPNYIKTSNPNPDVSVTDPDGMPPPSTVPRILPPY